MINTAKLREFVALERRSLTEIATASSIVAVVGATLYNLGFFAPIEWSLVSLLTVQDLLVGAAVALLPMLGAAWAALIGAKLILSAPRYKVRTLAIAVPLLALSSIGFQVFFVGPLQSTIAHLASGYLAIAALAGLVNLAFNSRHIATAWLGLSLLYIPFSLGVADSLASSSVNKGMSEIESDRGVLAGRVVRITSTYVLLATEGSIVTLPLSKVRGIKRVYVQSPEADFLKLAAPSVQ